MSSQAICKACILLEGLNKGLPHLGTQRTRGNGKRRSPQSIELKLEEEQSSAAEAAGAGQHYSPAAAQHPAVDGVGAISTNVAAGNEPTAVGTVAGS